MKIKPIIAASAALGGLSFLSVSALAQEATIDAQGEAAAAPEAHAVQAEVGAETEAPAPEPVEEAPMPAAEPATEVVVVETEAAEEAVEEEEGGASIFVFADAWMGWQTSKSGTPAIGAASGGAYALNGPDGTQQSGFGLNWLGMDLGYDSKYWAVNGSIRMGDAVPLYNVGSLGNRSGFGITNAYATLKPTEGLAIDLGVFGTIFGAEVAESWNNLNYTRGELYYNMQPFWHTGLRAAYNTGNFVVRAMVVNDPNTSNLGRGAVNVALQGGYDNGTFGFVAGALQSTMPKTTRNNFATATDPDAHTSSNFIVDTFVDAVMTLNVGDFSMIGNFDINLGYSEGTPQFWGASLAAAYHFIPEFGIALRGEYLSTPDGFLYGAGNGKEDLVTGTLTFDVKPIPDVEGVVLRWDNRIQYANQDVYANSKGDAFNKTWFGTVLGVVIYADLL